MDTVDLKGRDDSPDMSVATDAKDLAITVPANATTILLFEELTQEIYYSFTGLKDSWKLISPSTMSRNGNYYTIGIPTGTTTIYFRKSFMPRGGFSNLIPANGIKSQYTSHIAKLAADVFVKLVYDFVKW